MDFPILIPGWPKSWPCQKWTFHSLASLLKDKELSCRVWRKSDARVFETECKHMKVTLSHFCDWLEKKSSPDNPLYLYERQQYTCYIDYKYMKDMFESVADVLHDVKWSDFGLTDIDGYHSTIWIGSEGSNTPCHQDSYGFNLVTQIQGRKMWILFPPSDATYLYSSRIPYEESSVFSQVDIRKPDLCEHPNFECSHPVIVILNPGQSLYVPHLWWHYVESLEPSISLNVWIPLDEDKYQHVTEAITRCLATNLIGSLDPNQNRSIRNQLLNPTENLFPSLLNHSFLNQALEKAYAPSFDLIYTGEEKERRNPRNREQDEHTYEEKCSANKSMTSINHFIEFQQWVHQCELVDTTNSNINFLKRKSSSNMTCSLNKVLRKESSTQNSTIELTTVNISNDVNVTHSSQDQSKGEMQNYDTHNPFHPSSEILTEICPSQKLKIYALRCLPFHEYLSFLKSIPDNEISDGQVITSNSGTERHSNLNNHINVKSPCDESSCQQAFLNSSKEFDAPHRLESDSVSKMSTDVQCETQEMTSVSDTETLLTNSELAISFVSSVLDPSVITKISDLLQENYLRALKRKYNSDSKT